MKTLRIVMLTAALSVGGMGSAYARDSFGLSVNIGIPGYYAAPPAVVYYEPAPVRYYGAPARIYYSEPRHYYGHDHKWRGHDRKWRGGDMHYRHHHR